MDIGYTILASGRGSDWGECLLIDECLGKVIIGQAHIKDLPQDLIEYLLEGNVTEEGIEKLEEEFFDQNGNDSEYYYTLSNLLYHKKSPYIIKFADIGDLANYVRDYNLHVGYHLDT